MVILIITRYRRNEHSADNEKRFFRTVVIAFLSSVYLGRYRCMNFGNLNMFKRDPPKLV